MGVAAHRSGGSAGLSALAAVTEELPAIIANLNVSLNILSESTTYLVSKLIRAHVIADDIIQTERLRLARARSRNIDTQQQQVTVKGKEYWHVQVTVFASGA